MGALSQRATQLHRHVLNKLGYDLNLLETVVPNNQPVKTLVLGLYSAWLFFKQLLNIS